jgi:hypothetical protein
MQRVFTIKFIFVILIHLFVQNSIAQTVDCNFSEPILKIDFGTLANKQHIDLFQLNSYTLSKTICPKDGQYCFAAFTSDCFGSKWHDVLQDHTANDVNGRMMIVNASERPSVFFIHSISGLIGGKKYQVSFWITNICKYADGCSPTPPSIKLTLSNGKSDFSSFQTGPITQTAETKWSFYYGEFTLPQNLTGGIFAMEDLTMGGCGNDFAIDDIVFKECKITRTEIVAPTKLKTVLPKPILIDKPNVALNPKPKQKDNSPIVAKPTIERQVSAAKTIDKPKQEVKPTTAMAVKERPVILPKVITTRENALVRKIETDEAEMVIELYDNGDIDGDTVTIFHNNKMVVTHAGLSAKPITLKIKVDRNNPHHELIMVADNLGSIPPNTSLMIITANRKRYEVYISSSEQKNAKVVIDLK